MADETQSTNSDLGGGLNDAAKQAKEIFNKLTSPGEAMDKMVGAGNAINKSFGLARARIEEMKLAFVDSAAGVERVGGSLNDVVKTINEIAAASHRNVIENDDVVAKLYASSKVLNQSASDLVTKFKDVGYETSQIGPNLESSVEYIQNVGLNATTVMKDVTANMEKMNKFQFEGGVTGLAKMAAQASMLRFDMKQTFEFADRMLSPENAINMASAFQRLGVTAGNLVDPFVLMNDSINDPTGLQNSLAKLGQEFTYFDEETKSFKINPQGVLTLREMENEAHLASGSLSKSALAAADLDKRLSEVKMAGLKFENEDDKQYLANIAKMGKGGKYEVTLNDGTKKELQNLNQEEFDELIEQQKNAPKSMEEIARSQLSATENVAANTKAMVDKAYLGAVSSSDIRTNLEGLRNVVTTFSDKAQKMVPETPQVRKGVENAIGEMKNLLGVAMKDGFNSLNFANAMTDLKNKLTQQGSNMDEKTWKAIQNLTKEAAGDIKGKSQIEKMFKNFALGTSQTSRTPVQRTSTSQSQSGNVPLSRERFMGTSGRNYSENLSKTVQTNSKVDFGGTITIKVDAPSGVSQQQFKTYFESDEFKKKIYEYYQQKSKELEKQK
jgi:hypothetical protein